MARQDRQGIVVRWNEKPPSPPRDLGFEQLDQGVRLVVQGEQAARLIDPPRSMGDVEGSSDDHCDRQARLTKGAGAIERIDISANDDGPAGRSGQLV